MSHLHLLRSRGAFLYTYKSGLQQGKLLLVKSHRNILIVFRMLHKMGQGGGVFVHAAFSQNIVLRIDCHHKNLCGWPGMFHTSFTYPEGLDWIEAEFLFSSALRYAANIPIPPTKAAFESGSTNNRKWIWMKEGFCCKRDVFLHNMTFMTLIVLLWWFSTKFKQIVLRSFRYCWHFYSMCQTNN